MSSPAPAPNRAARRASPPKSNGHKFWTLNDWSHAKVLTISLGGRDVEFECPDVAAEIALGHAENPMAERLLKGTAEGESLNAEEYLQLREIQSDIVARHLVNPNLMELCGSYEAARKYVIEDLPSWHLKTLWIAMLTHNLNLEAWGASFRDGGRTAAPDTSGAAAPEAE